MRRLLLFTFVTLALVGCDETITGPTRPLNTEFVLAPGQTATVENVRVMFQRVAGDSRCPADAVCVWGGDALVQITAKSSSATRDYELHTGNREPVVHDDYTIHLVRVDPYPFSASSIEPDEYRVTLRVSR
jgi:hypothetical protein